MGFLDIFIWLIWKKACYESISWYETASLHVKKRKKSNLTFNHIRIKFEVRKYFIRPKLQPVYFGSRADATCKRCQRTKDRKAATSWSTCGRLVGFLYCLQLISTSEKKFNAITRQPLIFLALYSKSDIIMVFEYLKHMQAFSYNINLFLCFLHLKWSFVK